jgi:hypothetical protein
MVKVNRSRTFALLSLLALGAGAAAIACGGSAESPPRTTEVTIPETGLEVSATIASASLDDNSANVQMAFFASDAKAPATIAITSVILVDASTGNVVDTLEASTPAVWNGSSYETWNEKVTPGGDLRASYTLTAPKWSAIDGSETRATSYSRAFRLRMTLRIDGAEVTIESGELQRAPQMVT